MSHAERRSFDGVGVQPLQLLCGNSGPIGAVISLAAVASLAPQPAPAPILPEPAGPMGG